MTTENALPGADTPAAAGATESEVLAVTAPEVSAEPAPAEGEEKPAAKPEKTPEQREIDRLRRTVDRKTRQLYEARARANLTPQPVDSTNHATADDSEPLSLTRAQIDELVKAEAAKLAPTLREQAAEVERRTSVVQSLAKTWGQERFDELASDLDDVFGGLADSSGKPKPAIEAVFEADDPAAVIEYLADPENIDEAERIARMGAVQAGKAIAKLEARLASAAAKASPQPSKAPAPLEPLRGAGPASKALVDLDGDDFAKRRREQIAKRN